MLCLRTRQDTIMSVTINKINKWLEFTERRDFEIVCLILIKNWKYWLQIKFILFPINNKTFISKIRPTI